MLSINIDFINFFSLFGYKVFGQCFYFFVYTNDTDFVNLQNSIFSMMEFELRSFVPEVDTMPLRHAAWASMGIFVKSNRMVFQGSML
jgi:hypothetical protein